MLPYEEATELIERGELVAELRTEENPEYVIRIRHEGKTYYLLISELAIGNLVCAYKTKREAMNKLFMRAKEREAEIMLFE